MPSNKRYRRDIALVLILKLVLLSALWAAFFRDQPEVASTEAATHLLHNPEVAP